MMRIDMMTKNMEINMNIQETESNIQVIFVIGGSF